MYPVCGSMLDHLRTTMTQLFLHSTFVGKQARARTIGTGAEQIVDHKAISANSLTQGYMMQTNLNQQLNAIVVLDGVCRTCASAYCPEHA